MTAALRTAGWIVVAALVAGGALACGIVFALMLVEVGLILPAGIVITIYLSAYVTLRSGLLPRRPARTLRNATAATLPMTPVHYAPHAPCAQTRAGVA